LTWGRGPGTRVIIKIRKKQSITSVASGGNGRAQSQERQEGYCNGFRMKFLLSVPERGGHRGGKAGEMRVERKNERRVREFRMALTKRRRKKKSILDFEKT